MTAANDFAVRPGILSGHGGADQLLCGRQPAHTHIMPAWACVAERPLAVGVLIEAREASSKPL